ncbi:MAG: glycine cleavage T C-terminal barrel domain-containing protein [Alphaproteobacteria bacterium]|jgi:aminomethyltransferase|nr:glycine cleavage T C-terminal barrel domain-containing protein [Alphaproteobacteria bacterium]
MTQNIVPTPRIRKSPYFEATLRAGASQFTVYNKVYMPFGYDTPEGEFQAIIDAVTVWDVTGQRVVEISGPDAYRFTSSLTPRDLSTCLPGRCRYIFITDPHGGILNDPVLLRLDEDRFWLSCADSDMAMWARGVAVHAGLDVRIDTPDVSTLQVQGPFSREVIRALFGDEMADLGYYHCRPADLEGIPLVVSRTGFTAELGFELYLMDGSRGTELWDMVMAAGQPFGMKPAAPSRIRRIEAGILDYGTDMDESVNPFELGFDRLVDLDKDIDFIGRAALRRIKADGVHRRAVGLEVAGAPISYNDRSWPLYHGTVAVGQATSIIYSPRLEKNIALAMVGTGAEMLGTLLRLLTPDGERDAVVCPRPFVDPQREISKA